MGLQSFLLSHWWLGGGLYCFLVFGAAALLLALLLVYLLGRHRRLARRESSFEELLRYLDDVFWTSSSEGKVHYVSQAVEKIYGRPAEDFIKQPDLWREVIHPEDRPGVPNAFEDLPGEGYFSKEYRIVRPDGQVRWVLDRKTVLQTGKPGPVLLGGAVTDITARKRYEQVLQESEQTYRSLFEGSNAVKLLIDPETGLIVDANQAACKYYGYTKQQLQAIRIEQINQLSAEEVRQEMRRARELDLNHFFFRHRLADGRIRDVEVYSNPVEIAGRELLFSIIHDVTDRRRAQRALKEHEEKLRALASQLALVEERNRQDVAAALHDHIGQTLAALKVRAGLLQQASDLEEVHARAQRMIADIERLMKETWSLTFELCPPSLYEVGLTAALEWLCQEFSGRYEIEITYHDDGKAKPLSDRLRGMIFQMVRELLVNVVKHSEADQAQVESLREGEWLKILVKDNGRGFDLEAQNGENQQVGRFGLFSIRERLGHFSGRLEARSVVGRGSSMTLLLPLAAGQSTSGAKDAANVPDPDSTG